MPVALRLPTLVAKAGGGSSVHQARGATDGAEIVVVPAIARG